MGRPIKLKLLNCKNLIFLGLIYAATGCSGTSTRLNYLHESVDVDDVGIFYTQRPTCNYEVIAYLQSSGGYYSLEGLFNNLRKEAAVVGASALYVTHTQRLDIGEYYGSAQAIKCNPFPSQAF